MKVKISLSPFLPYNSSTYQALLVLLLNTYRICLLAPSMAITLIQLLIDSWVFWGEPKRLLSTLLPIPPHHLLASCVSANVPHVGSKPLLPSSLAPPECLVQVCRLLLLIHGFHLQCPSLHSCHSSGAIQSQCSLLTVPLMCAPLLETLVLTKTGHDFFKKKVGLTM